ncbi:MAG: TRAM domain-containing protein [Nanoarchaeota archaeon]
MYRDFRQRSFAPVNVGEELDLNIEAVGEKGDGIAKIKGFVIFVPNTKKGDEVKVRITKVFKKVGFGEVVGQSTEKPKKSRKKEETEEGFEEESQENTEDLQEEPAESEEFGG